MKTDINVGLNLYQFCVNAVELGRVKFGNFVHDNVIKIYEPRTEPSTSAFHPDTSRGSARVWSRGEPEAKLNFTTRPP